MPPMMRAVIAIPGGILACSAVKPQVRGPMIHVNVTNEQTPMTSHIHDVTTVRVHAQRRAAIMPFPNQKNATDNVM
jgi:hypothetical protein